MFLLVLRLRRLPAPASLLLLAGLAALSVVLLMPARPAAALAPAPGPLPTLTLPLPTLTLPPPTVTPTLPAPTLTLLSPTATAPGRPTATATSCPIAFSDVPPGSPFYAYVRCLACRGLVSGYADGTYRPYVSVTRGQTAKITANAGGLPPPLPTVTFTFQDVPQANPFWAYIQELYVRHAVSGYNCGGPDEPCVPPQDRPYFRAYGNVTRSQIAKIIALAAFLPAPHGPRQFEDVPASNPFYTWVQAAAEAGLISGYDCGGPNEPCIPPANRPYFRPYNAATRGQTTKIVANSFFPDCQTPGR